MTFTPHFKSVHYDKYVSQMSSLETRIIAITGTSTGTGKAVAKAIALKGGHVLALNRPSERSRASSKEIRDTVPNCNITDIVCDLTSFDSVRAAAVMVQEACNGAGLDALVLNAGVQYYITTYLLISKFIQLIYLSLSEKKYLGLFSRVQTWGSDSN
jgi:NAD(P)-dependent dehydrogenase (short-subunit alcohol dehydrogenase family)